MNKYEEVKKEIVKVVPSIMELGFGCEYLDLHNRKQIFINKAGRGEHRYLTEEGMFGEMLNINMREILGRPITLEDVLIAIDKISKPRGNNYFIDTKGSFYKTNEDLYDIFLGNWQLGKPLHSQSQEVIDFLYELLVNKKQL